VIRIELANDYVPWRGLVLAVLVLLVVLVSATEVWLAAGHNRIRPPHYRSPCIHRA